jgi:Holliday junction DNA helicase RuvA
MIAILRGEVLSVAEQSLVINVNGLGFAVMTTPALRARTATGEELTLHTSLIVREDSFTLFGYLTGRERDLFQLLQTVSGIGPKVSHAILSALDISEIIRAISGGDSKKLEQVSGLGKKGAQRIILELKEKVAQLADQDGLAPLDSAARPGASTSSGAISLTQALTGLGFTSREVDHALEIVKGSTATTLEEQLKIALTALNSGGARA